MLLSSFISWGWIGLLQVMVPFAKSVDFGDAVGILAEGALSLDDMIEPSQVSLGCSLRPRRNIRINSLPILLSCITLVAH